MGPAEREIELVRIMRMAFGACCAALWRDEASSFRTSGLAEGEIEKYRQRVMGLFGGGSPADPSDVPDGWRTFSGSGPTADATLILIDSMTTLPVADEQRMADAFFGALGAQLDAQLAQDAVARANAVIQSLETMAEIGLWQVDLDRGIVRWSDMTFKIHGVERGEFSPDLQNAMDFYPEEVRGVVQNNVQKAIDEGSGFSFVLPFRRADGDLRTVRGVGNVLNDGDRRELFGIFQDVTVMKEAELRLWWTANHDALTSLPNRMLFQERLDAALLIAEQQNQSVGLIIIDLDHFKSINDVYGHEAGDELLQEVARRLQSHMRQGDTLARLGGDEFAIIVNDLTAPGDLATPLNRLLKAADIDFVYRETPIPVKLSMGAAVYPRDADSERELYRNADIALFRTKADPDRRGTIYNPSHGEEQDGREARLRRIREAVAVGAIAPYFQPVFDLATGQVASVEVLARWREGEELLSASALQPAFEDPELAPQIGLAIIDQLTKGWCSLDPAILKSTPLSINVSPREIQNLGYLNALEEFTGLLADGQCALILELNHNPFHTLPSHVMASFQALLERGISFGFDTLATGFEALVETSGIRVHQIKANKSTLTDPEVEERAAAVIGGMIETCRQLGVQLIGTEIETEYDLRRLRQLGYTLGQGFYFSKAMQFRELRQLLESYRSTVDGPAVNVHV
ncbi:MAG: diguanylate cyclase [Pseudomonadota bacterium]